MEDTQIIQAEVFTKEAKFIRKPEKITKAQKFSNAAKQVLLRELSKEYIPIIQALAESAKGVFYEADVSTLDIDPETKQKIKTKTVKVFVDKPDTRAAEYLINQVVGKPKETVEHQGHVNLIIDE